MLSSSAIWTKVWPKWMGMMVTKGSTVVQVAEEAWETHLVWVASIETLFFHCIIMSRKGKANWKIHQRAHKIHHLTANIIGLCLNASTQWGDFDAWNCRAQGLDAFLDRVRHQVVGRRCEIHLSLQVTWTLQPWFSSSLIKPLCSKTVLLLWKWEWWLSYGSNSHNPQPSGSCLGLQ